MQIPFVAERDGHTVGWDLDVQIYVSGLKDTLGNGITEKAGKVAWHNTHWNVGEVVVNVAPEAIHHGEKLVADKLLDKSWQDIHCAL